MPFLKEFLEYLLLERGLARKTVDAYRNDLVIFGEFLEKNSISDVKEITRDSIREFLAVEQQRGMAPKSLARELVAIKAFFRFLAVTHVREDDITEVMLSPKLPQPVPDALSVEEVARLLAAYDTPPDEKSRVAYLRNRTILALLYATGMRVTELCDLRLTSVNFNDGLLKARGKGDKERMIPFDQNASRALQDYVKDARPVLDVSGRSPYLILNKHGRRLDRHQMWLVVQEAGVLAGIQKHIHPHLLRHSFATHLIANGADLRATQELLGHASVNTTQVYLATDVSRAREIFKKFHPRA